MEVAAAEEALRRETSVPALLRAACPLIADAAGADACVVSRLVGDLIVDVAEFSRDGRALALGYGYLLTDFPLTRETVVRREARVVYAADTDADEKEVALLRELRFDGLLMLPLEAAGERWGLTELYVAGPGRFGPEQEDAARRLVDRTGEQVARLESATSS